VHVASGVEAPATDKESPAREVRYRAGRHGAVVRALAVALGDVELARRRRGLRAATRVNHVLEHLHGALEHELELVTADQELVEAAEGEQCLAVRCEDEAAAKQRRLGVDDIVRRLLLDDVELVEALVEDRLEGVNADPAGDEGLLEAAAVGGDESVAAVHEAALGREGR
jgi:hypothetical protein